MGNVISFPGALEGSAKRFERDTRKWLKENAFPAHAIEHAVSVGIPLFEESISICRRGISENVSTAIDEREVENLLSQLEPRYQRNQRDAFEFMKRVIANVIYLEAEKAKAAEKNS